MDSLNSLGWKIHDHLKEFRPKMFQSLKDQGNLNQHVLDLQNQADDQLTTLEHQGYQPHEAMEMLRDQIFPPTEEDVPNLGETLQPYLDSQDPTLSSPTPTSFPPDKKGSTKPTSTRSSSSSGSKLRAV